MSSDDVTGVVLIIPKVKPHYAILTFGWCWWNIRLTMQCPQMMLLVLCWSYPVKVKLCHAIEIGGVHAVQILMIEKGWHDSTAATHDNGLDAAVNPTWSMVNGIWLVCKASIQDDLQLYLWCVFLRLDFLWCKPGGMEEILTRRGALVPVIAPCGRNGHLAWH